jgi:hypothetical protein
MSSQSRQLSDEQPSQKDESSESVPKRKRSWSHESRQRSPRQGDSDDDDQGHSTRTEPLTAETSFKNDRSSRPARASSPNEPVGKIPPYSGPVLPPGWKEVWSTSKQKYYYLHRESRRTMWDFHSACPPYSGSKLPTGWMHGWSKSRQDFYYEECGSNFVTFNFNEVLERAKQRAGVASTNPGDVDRSGQDVHRQETCSRRMSIPAWSVRHVIGKQGSNIKFVKQKSGATHMQVEDCADNSNFRNVTMSGTLSALDEAETLISAKVQFEAMV